ncbi:VWA domain-containing protein [Fulvimarina endophytica]|uniref:VWA domain-containing protein n=1 Tax=Fulvimarina endophytica TaxID=2293836 RepID=A0A371X8S0_9HYPH|nr:VWA domain-containing protein [Fulvimarina endophytica]RFC65464.1 VWA domain-containing protein [Fulvimarina endophytica]
MELGPVLLLRPLWLLAIPALVLLTVLALRRARGLGAWERAIDPELLSALRRFGRVVPGKARRILPPVGIAAVTALALSSPATRTSDPQTFRNLDGVVVAIDLSRSIVEGGGLDDAQIAVQSVLQNSGGRPVAMILFSGDAYMASAFTTDAGALSPLLAVLGGDIIPNPGSRADRALALAEKVFSEAGILSGDVVLVTDGDHLTPEAGDIASRLASNDIHVDALLIEPSGRNGDMPPADPAALERLTEIGGGAFGSAADPAPTARAIGRRAAQNLTTGEAAALFYRDYGRYGLVLALPFALLLFRRTT